MNPPSSHAYSLFTVCEPSEAMARSHAELQTLQARWREFEGELDPNSARLVERSIQALTLSALPERERGQRAAPGTVEERFYTTQFVNLADAPHSWSVLELDADQARLCHRSAWRPRRD